MLNLPSVLEEAEYLLSTSVFLKKNVLKNTETLVEKFFSFKKRV